MCSFSASLGFADVHVIQIAEVSHMQIDEGCWVGKKVYCVICVEHYAITTTLVRTGLELTTTP